jgi:hypothetical protein
MFFKRRSRANSYVDNDPPRSQSYDDYDKQRPDSSSTQKHQQHVSSPTEEDMYARPQQPQEPQQQFARGGVPTGAMNALSMGQPAQPAPLNVGKAEPMPDLLAQAFNQAVRPYTEKIEHLESQLADMQAWIEQLEQQRAEVHGWIDKRGLRPGTFPPLLGIPSLA